MQYGVLNSEGKGRQIHEFVINGCTESSHFDEYNVTSTVDAFSLTPLLSHMCW